MSSSWSKAEDSISVASAYESTSSPSTALPLPSTRSSFELPAIAQWPSWPSMPLSVIWPLDSAVPPSIFGLEKGLRHNAVTRAQSMEEQCLKKKNAVICTFLPKKSNERQIISASAHAENGQKTRFMSHKTL